MPKAEQRTIPTEFRSERVGPGRTQRKLMGHAAMFNVMSEDLGGWREMIMPGAFDDCMEDDVRCYFNHDRNMILGRTSSKTLRLAIDEKGLAYECDLPDTTCGRDLAVSMDRGDVNQSSFSFVVSDAVWEMHDGMDVRIVKRCSALYDVSPVSHPAYSASDVSLRSAAEILSTRPERPPVDPTPEPPPAGVPFSVELEKLRLDLSLSL